MITPAQVRNSLDEKAREDIAKAEAACEATLRGWEPGKSVTISLDSIAPVSFAVSSEIRRRLQSAGWEVSELVQGSNQREGAWAHIVAWERPSVCAQDRQR